MRYALVVILFAVNLAAADQAELWMQEGLKILKEKPESVVQAAGLFAKAADAYEASGNQEKAVEANSCLYWTRKKFTIRDLNIVTQGNPVAAKRMEIVIAPRKDDPKPLLEKVDEFAKTSKDSLLIAIRYFEIADRFPTTDEGRKAMDSSLKAMSKINLKEEGPKTAVKPVIQSDDKEFIGKWKTAQHGPWIISKEGDDIILKEEGFAFTSTNTLKVAEGIIFQWNAEPNLIVAFVKSGKNIIVKCYRTEKFDGDVLHGKALWSLNATFVKP